ncbi:hypothetical protein MLD38_034001 [Melastoma candidum]|uniref:Uncharacterized protein n=1 Tax=Melastoma candidum TaxID=119954 RepID=A0ACB9M8J7_9MYRT|nr:hypothetical protein MLD38_034001 [Melastoma candidum]
MATAQLWPRPLCSDHTWFSFLAADKTVATKRNVGALEEADLKGKRVFVRVDLNVPLDDSLNIADDTRIKAAVPTIQYLISDGSIVILSSHLCRPKGVTPKYSLRPLVPRLTQLLGVDVSLIPAHDPLSLRPRLTPNPFPLITFFAGYEVEKLVAETLEGGVLLLENVRFYKEEDMNDPEFAKKLASLGDVYVNYAFGTARRALASTGGVAKYLKPSVLGCLTHKEKA